MITAVKTRVIKIGNSQGIRIPKPLLNQTDLGDEVELELHQNQIVIRRVHRARHNWESQFKAMAEQGDDKLLNGDVPTLTTWDEDEWELCGTHTRSRTFRSIPRQSRPHRGQRDQEDSTVPHHLSG